MTDKQLKEKTKQLFIVVGIIMVMIAILAVYILHSKKAETTIYTSAEYTDNLQALGVNQDEFEEYLSIFGDLVNDALDEDEKNMNMAAHFMESMYAAYEVQTDENGLKMYDADKVKDVLKELNGAYIKGNIDGGEWYTYDEEKNVYVQKKEGDTLPRCVEISDISKNGEQIEVTYELAEMTSEQMAAVSEGNDVELEKHTVKAVIMENSDYKYSKYFVSEIAEK